MSEDAQGPDFVMHSGEKTSLLFMQMVFQLSGLASLLLGKMPHPETGETTRDLESAQQVIDQLDMLETKTKGNLNPEEAKLLRQTLMSLRMAYVEAVNHPEPASGQEEKKKEEAPPPVEPGGEAPETGPATDAPSTKKFTKKY